MKQPSLGRSAPAAFVLVVCVVAWLSTGVGLGDAGLFGAHELGFVLLPGCVIYAALRERRPGALQLAAVGYAVGSVLEILAFALTAALHARGALWAYPPLAVALGFAALRRRPREPGVAVWDRRSAWTLAAVCAAAVGYLLAAYFLFEPLPSRARSVVYIPDLVFHLGVAAEALHHWPITDPKVSGASLPYENFIYMKLAAASQLTHIPLPTLLFRLYILPLVVAIVALLATAGRVVSGRRLVGILAAGLFLFVGQLGLDSHEPLVFANTVFFSIYDSPSYVLGLLMFLAALVVLYEQLSAERSPSRRGWLVLTLLLIGCAGAKATILPVLLGGLVLYLVRYRGRDRPAAVALALTASTFLLTYWLLYAGGSGGLHVELPGSVRLMTAVQYAGSRLSTTPLFWIVASVVGLVGFAGAILAGLPAALASADVRRLRAVALLPALLLCSFGPFFGFMHKGGSQNFFTYYGLAAGSTMSAWGLVLIWDRAQPLPRRAAAMLAGSIAAWIVVLLLAAIGPYVVSAQPRIGPLYALWLGLPLLAVAALIAAARRSRRWAPTLRVIAVGAVVAVGLLDTPLHTGRFLSAALRIRSTPYARDSPQAQGLTPQLQRALSWVRHHTPTDAVLAVNNQFSDATRQSPDYYYYSAFGERRIFLEGWEDTIAAAGFQNPLLTPFPDRLRLNNAVFFAADAGALQVLRRRFGVSYLLVDRAHGPVQPRLRTLAATVFSNPAATIYELVGTRGEGR